MQHVTFNPNLNPLILIVLADTNTPTLISAEFSGCMVWHVLICVMYSMMKQVGDNLKS